MIFLIGGLIACIGIVLVFYFNFTSPEEDSIITTQEKTMDTSFNTELIGKSDELLLLKGLELYTKVNFDSTIMKDVRRSLIEPSSTNTQDKIYLHLENVKGSMDANTLKVTVNQQSVGHISLYGLRSASSKANNHDGKGLTFILEITHIIKLLYLEKASNIDLLDVGILPDNSIPNEHKVTIEQISIYREQHK